MARVPSDWEQIVAADPTHSERYVERFRRMAREGHDLAGEARMVDAMVGRGSRILDAGCGPGPVRIEAAEADHPGPTWLVGDLAELDLPARGIDEGFDVVVCGGNVMTFLAASTRVEVLRRMGSHLADGGRLVVGFGSGRGYDFGAFRMDARVAGLTESLMLSSWDLRPFRQGSGFLVAVLER